jgi:hypothetical protein
MSSTKAVQSTTTVAIPAPTVTIPVTFNTEEFPVIETFEFNSADTVPDSVGYVKCILTIRRRHVDGSTVVGYTNGSVGSGAEFYVMATQKSTPNALKRVSAQLLTTHGHLRFMTDMFKAQCGSGESWRRSQR